jgi:hypothetical protein
MCLGMYIGVSSSIYVPQNDVRLLYKYVSVLKHVLDSVGISDGR